MKIPDRWLLFALWASLWVSRFYLAPVYFERTQELNYYPIDADSIGIPILGNFFITIFGAPLFIFYLRSVFRGSQPQNPTWFAWSRAHPFKSLFWTLLYGSFACICIQSLRESIRIQLPFHAFIDASWCYLWLGIRAITVSKLCLPPPVQQAIPQSA
jgi:hypothetical protein